VRPTLSCACTLIVKLPQLALDSKSLQVGIELRIAFLRQGLAELIDRAALRRELESSFDDPYWQ
jgi:hypothetical protein